MGIDRPKIIRTFRLSLTCIFLFLLTWYYQVPESGWALMTIWFVMFEYSTVGGVLAKSFLRFVGTSLSALYGIIIVYTCGNDPLINTLAFVPGLFVYTYFFMGGDKTYIGTIGAATLAIILFNYNDIDTAIIRVVNVVLGIISSMIMILFFYPQYSRDVLLETQSNWIKQILSLLNDYLNPSISLDSLREDSIQYEQFVLSNSPVYERLVNEAKMETKDAPFFVPKAKEILKQFKLLCRLISILIFHISTEALRADPWVINQMNLLLKKLQIIHARLNRSKIGAQLEEAVEEEPNPELVITENKRLIEDLFNNLNEVVASLDEEVKNSILIYDFYDPVIDRA